VSITSDDPHISVTIKCAKRKDAAPFPDLRVYLAECGPSVIVEEIDYSLEAAQKYGDDSQALVDYLTRSKWTSVRDVAEALDMSKSGLDRLLKHVTAQGRIAKIGTGYGLAGE
jgi:hypothetical protein